MYCFSEQSNSEDKIIDQKNYRNCVEVAIVSSVVLGHLFKNSRHLIGLNCILLCRDNSSKISKRLILSRQFVHENHGLFTTKSVIQFVRTVACLLRNTDLSPVVMVTGDRSNYCPTNSLMK